MVNKDILKGIVVIVICIVVGLVVFYVGSSTPASSTATAGKDTIGSGAAKLVQKANNLPSSNPIEINPSTLRPVGALIAIGGTFVGAYVLATRKRPVNKKGAVGHT